MAKTSSITRKPRHFHCKQARADLSLFRVDYDLERVSIPINLKVFR